MTDKELDESEARAKSASPGPWECAEDDEYSLAIGNTNGVHDANGESIVKTDSGVYPPDRATGAFIAASRTDVPKLVATVRALQAENAALRDLLESHGIPSRQA